MARAQRAEPSGACAGELPVSENEYRCGYARIRAFERQRAASILADDESSWSADSTGRSNCRDRISTTSSSMSVVCTELAGSLDSRGPGRGPRDYMIIDTREKGSEKSQRLAYRRAAEQGFELLGVCDRYEVLWIDRRRERTDTRQ